MSAITNGTGPRVRPRRNDEVVRSSGNDGLQTRSCWIVNTTDRPLDAVFRKNGEWQEITFAPHKRTLMQVSPHDQSMGDFGIQVSLDDGKDNVAGVYLKFDDPSKPMVVAIGVNRANGTLAFQDLTSLSKPQQDAEIKRLSRPGESVSCSKITGQGSVANPFTCPR